MERLRHIVFRYRYGLWVLTAAVVLQLAVPLHLHLHHVDHHDSAATSHTSDLHLDDGIADHEHHSDAHIIDLSVDTAVKTWGGDSVVPLFIVYLFALLLIPLVRRLPHYQYSANRLTRRPFLISPPLRAPPFK